MDLTPEQKFNAEPVEKMVPRMFLEGFDRDQIIDTLIALDWEPQEARYLVDCYIAKQEGRAIPPRLPAKPSTPQAVMIMCVLGLIGALATVGEVSLGQKTGMISLGSPAYLLLGAGIKAVCYVGLMQMRRWGIVAYFIFFPIDQFLGSLLGTWNPISLIFALGILFVGQVYWTQMR